MPASQGYRRMQEVSAWADREERKTKEALEALDRTTRIHLKEAKKRLAQLEAAGIDTEVLRDLRKGIMEVAAGGDEDLFEEDDDDDMDEDIM
jgi:hypothetical protein